MRDVQSIIVCETADGKIESLEINGNVLARAEFTPIAYNWNEVELTILDGKDAGKVIVFEKDSDYLSFLKLLRES